ncbi:MAG: hypothetical protein HY288_00075 [Planctomycetia bacterium]|nr:hypothetical protein [Planctomycetia bacterium]
MHPKVELEITRGRAQQRVREVRGAAFLIGTASDCDLVLGDPQFAEVHSYLLLSPTRVTVRHLGFGPGLSVAGQDVTWATLRHNDELRTGPYEFRVRIHWPARQLTGPIGSEAHQAPLATRATDHRRVADKLMSDIRADSYPPLRLSLYVEGEPDPASGGVPAGQSCSRTAALAAILGQPKRNRGS